MNMILIEFRLSKEYSTINSELMHKPNLEM